MSGDHAGYHNFPDGESFEVFEATEKDPVTFPDENGEDLVHTSGWFWWPCSPGEFPHGDVEGPFASSQDAYNNAQER